MKIDIPYYIRQILREHREVHVPGVGVFHMRQHPATFTEDKSTILPPSLRLHFDSVQSDNTDLFSYIMDLGTHSKKKIEAAISDFTESTFAGLVTGEPYSIHGVGTLRKAQDSDKVSFTPSVAELTREYKNLPTISANPIERISVAQSVNHAIEMGGMSSRPTSNTWWAPILAGILIAVLAIFAVKTCRSSADSGEYNTIQQLDSDADDNNEKIIDSLEQEDIDRRYQEVDSLLEGSVDSGLGGGKIVEELAQLDNNFDEDTDFADEEDISDNDDLEIDIGNEDTTVASEKSIYENLIPASGQCIIILGSFTKASNITKMVSLVERNGHTLHRSQYGDKTRVGFTFDCTDVEIDSYLNEIRERYAAKAWYLDPTVSIPYQ